MKRILRGARGGYGARVEARSRRSGARSMALCGARASVSVDASCSSVRRGGEMTVVQPALAPPRIVSEDAPDGSRDPALGDAARAVRGEPRRAACGAGRGRRRTACSWPSAAPDGDWVELTWGEAGRKANARRPGAARPRARAQAAGDDPLRQLDRPRTADARRLPGRRAGRAGLARLLADEPGLRQGQAHRGAGQARARLRGRRRAVRRRAGGRRLRRRRDRALQGHRRDALRRPGRHARRRRRSTRRWRAVGPDSVAKILFTSGSTAMPKGVHQHARDARAPTSRARADLAVHRPTRRRCSSTGCRGTTRSAATTTST